MRSSLALAGVEFAILRRDPAPVLVMVVIPLLFVPFLSPGVSALLEARGFAVGSGAQYVVPALAVLFAMLNGQQLLTSLYRDHHWGVWDRLRFSQASLGSILLGKSLPGVVVQFAQLIIVLAGGALLFGYRPAGSVLGVGIVALLFAVTMVAFGLALFAVCRTENQAMTLVTVLGMAMAGIGGAFGPVTALPEWIQATAHASPAYWALSAISALSLEGAPFASILLPCGALVAFICGFFAIAILAVRHRSQEPR